MLDNEQCVGLELLNNDISEFDFGNNSPEIGDPEPVRRSVRER